MDQKRLPDGTRGHINANLPFVFVTARINLAHKLEADLKKRGVDVHKLGLWNIAKYQDCIIVIDECVTAAGSLVNGVTVHHPTRTLQTLRKVTGMSCYLFLMDAEHFDADGKGKTLLKDIAHD